MVPLYHCPRKCLALPAAVLALSKAWRSCHWWDAYNTWVFAATRGEQEVKASESDVAGQAEWSQQAAAAAAAGTAPWTHGTTDCRRQQRHRNGRSDELAHQQDQQSVSLQQLSLALALATDVQFSRPHLGPMCLKNRISSSRSRFCLRCCWLCSRLWSRDSAASLYEKFNHSFFSQLSADFISEKKLKIDHSLAKIF